MLGICRTRTRNKNERAAVTRRPPRSANRCPYQPTEHLPTSRGPRTPGSSLKCETQALDFDSHTQQEPLSPGEHHEVPTGGPCSPQTAPSTISCNLVHPEAARSRKSGTRLRLRRSLTCRAEQISHDFLQLLRASHHQPDVVVGVVLRRVTVQPPPRRRHRRHDSRHRSWSGSRDTVPRYAGARGAVAGLVRRRNISAARCCVGL